MCAYFSQLQLGPPSSATQNERVDQGGHGPNGSPTPVAKDGGEPAGDGGQRRDQEERRDGLLPQHADFLRKAGVTDAVQRARGYRSVTEPADLASFKFGTQQQRAPTLVIPVLNAKGAAVSHQIRPDRPRHVDDVPLEYEVPEKSHLSIDFPWATVAVIPDAAVPLYITNGIVAADVAVSQGLVCIALLGDWCWSRKDENKKRQPLPDWDSITLAGRRVFLLFDPAFVASVDVYRRLLGLADYLEAKGATVRFIYLPADLKDFLAAHQVTDLQQLAEDNLRPSSHCPYRITPSGIVWDKPQGDGTIAVPLTNFQVEIVGDVAVEDGVDVRRQFEVEATVQGVARRFVVAAAEFGGMAWVQPELGPTAVVYPRKEHEARAAIQLLSRRIVHRRTIAHTGYLKNGNEWGYAHAGGIIWADHGLAGAGALADWPSPNSCDVNELNAIGPVGTVTNTGMPSELINVDLSGSPMALYELPAPPTGDDRILAFQAVLRFLDLGGGLTVMLAAAVFRAALGYARFSIHLAGPSGAFKSAVAALFQQFFGPALNAEKFVGNWSSTANQLEGLLHDTKDCPGVIDELVANGPPGDVAELWRKVDRVFRAQGNCSSRGRLRAGGGSVPYKRPRGLPLSTGETIPPGMSLLARIFVYQVWKGLIPEERLTDCQRDAAQGLYAQAMATFVQTVVSNKDRWDGFMPQAVERYRHLAAVDNRHRRTADIVADLLFGFESFLVVARMVGAIDEAEATRLMERAKKEILQIAADQALIQVESDPLEQFRIGVAAALAGGTAHVANKSGEEPEKPEAHGWRRRLDNEGNESWIPGGRCIGWLQDDKELYLDSANSLAVARENCHRCGINLTLTPAALRQLLKNRGHLLATEEKRGHLTVRRTLAGKRREVIFIDKDFFFGDQHDDENLPVADPALEAQADRDFHKLLDPDWSPQSEDAPGKSTLPEPLASIFQGVYDLERDLRGEFVLAKQAAEKSPGPVINCSTIRVLQEQAAMLADEVERYLHPEVPLEDIMEA
jgi:hypothetical protein